MTFLRYKICVATSKHLLTCHCPATWFEKVKTTCNLILIGYFDLKLSLIASWFYMFINFLSAHEVNRNLTSKFKLSLSPVTNKIKVQVNSSAVCLHIWISRRFPWEGFVLIFIFHWFTFKFKLNFTAARNHSSLHLPTVTNGSSWLSDKTLNVNYLIKDYIRTLSTACTENNPAI